MELLEGETLYDRMTRVRQLDVGDDARDRDADGARPRARRTRRTSCTAI